LAKELNLADRLGKIGKNVALQGELMGPGIQKNNERLGKCKFFVFTVFDIDAWRRLDFEETKKFMDAINGDGGPAIDHVPVLGVFKAFDELRDMDGFLRYAQGPSLNPERPREGVVFKSRLVAGNVVSFKVISNGYLLSEAD
jgi:ATP-dependent RNA circularization protein (DNA/RNA ligase family)